jgi:hypothetical protein
MRSTLGILVLLVGSAGLTAQDLEPNLARAAQRLSGALARRLVGDPGQHTGLDIEPLPGTSASALGTVARTLGEDGFRLTLGGAEPRAGYLLLRLSASEGAGGGRVALETPDGSLHLVCSHGDADWVDEVDSDRLVIQGPFRSSAAEAREAAFEETWRRVVRRLENPDLDTLGPEALDAWPISCFVGWSDAPEGRVYRAWVGLRPDARGAARLERQIEETRDGRREAFLVRSGLTVLLALVLLFSCTAMDLRTRGYMTGTLRIGFGILFLIGSLACWGVQA